MLKHIVLAAFNKTIIRPLCFLIMISATLKSVDYNVAMTVILNNNNNILVTVEGMAVMLVVATRVAVIVND